jgi:uncharacterized membrane protein YgcG
MPGCGQDVCQQDCVQVIHAIRHLEHIDISCGTTPHNSNSGSSSSGSNGGGSNGSGGGSW